MDNDVTHVVSYELGDHIITNLKFLDYIYYGNEDKCTHTELDHKYTH